MTHLDQRRQRKQPPQHGTATTYKNGCRCDECKTAGAEANRERRERYKTNPPARPVPRNNPPTVTETIEQAIARGWATSRIMTACDASYETVIGVRAAMNEAAGEVTA